ncbi:MAG: carbohydrate kinase family protein [Mycobacteriales bacterium]|nr:carbohydrate kinase family protein [Mycobacteriales bacterium]
MKIAVTGSIATDHLMTFDGRFAEQILPDQLDKISLVFLASDLQVRRGGTGANIAFGMGVLGQRPLLVGSVGRDAGDYLQWLADHGVDTSGVRVSETLASPRFTVTTDNDQNQIGAFYPGAMAEAVGIELAPLGEVDLVVVAPNDPGAMLRHTAECTARGVAFAADPSQTLSFLDGDAIRTLCTGATWLFTNEYEAGLVREKTGWSDADVLEVVGTRVTTHGADGVVITRKGEDDIRVGVVPADAVAEPTGVGDAFRAGFLTGTSWGLGLECAAQVGALLATHVVETVGTQEYSFTPGSFLARLAKAYGDEAAAEVAPHLSA